MFLKNVHVFDLKFNQALMVTNVKINLEFDI